MNTAIVVKHLNEAKELQIVLESQGEIVVVLTKPLQALNIINESIFGKVYVSMDLEGMKGPDLAYQIKIKNRKLEILLMFQEGVAEPIIKAALRKARLDNYVCAPFQAKKAFTLPLPPDETLGSAQAGVVTSEESGIFIKQGELMLKMQQFEEALDNFERAALAVPMTDKLHVYCLWAQLELLDLEPENDRQNTLEVLASSVERMGQKGLDTPEKEYVMGLYSQIRNDEVTALKHYMAALRHNPNFTDAKLKIRSLKMSA